MITLHATVKYNCHCVFVVVLAPVKTMKPIKQEIQMWQNKAEVLQNKVNEFEALNSELRQQVELSAQQSNNSTYFLYNVYINTYILYIILNTVEVKSLIHLAESAKC